MHLHVTQPRSQPFLRLRPWLAALLALLCLAVPARAQDYTAGTLAISDVWARPSLGSTGGSAAYITILNAGSEPDRLLAVKSDVAKDVELHTTLHEGNVMRMRRVEDGLAIPPGEALQLKPGGHHVMLLGLTRKLSEGESFPATLVFERQGEVAVEVKVQKSGATGH